MNEARPPSLAPCYVPSMETARQLSGRYALQRRIGAGGFGEVHAAHDNHLGVEVALKMLRRTEPRNISRFKREFRALATLSHPNLVVLHELGLDEGTWFYTMELIDGTTFGHAGSATVLDTATWDETLASPVATQGRGPGHHLFQPVLSALIQLADAVAYIHRAGTLHCDLKPSNVLVEPDGRLVLVDFGLATLLEPTGVAKGGRAGTPNYMAPEQTRGELSPAIDCYALGIMVFEALSGRLPFIGSGHAILQSKLTRLAPRLSSMADVPDDIDELVARALDPVAGHRPSAAEIHSVLERVAGRKQRTMRLSTRAGSPEVIMRGHETRLAELLFDGEPSQRGQLVVGPSGIGKTVLTETIRHELERRGALVLSSRCYERERAPFEVLDGVIHALFEQLEDLGLAHEDDVTRAIEQLGPLAPALSGPTGESRDDLTARRERDKALAALSRLVSKLTAHHRVVVFVDDLQWIDADGSHALGALFRTCPELRLLATLRDGDSAGARFGAAIHAEQVVLEPLDDESARRLLSTMVRHRQPDADRMAALIHQAGGNPLLLAEIGTHMADSAGDMPRSLGEIVAERLDPLGPEACALLQLLGVAARPLDDVVLVRACSHHLTCEPSRVVRGLYRLRGAHLVRRESETHVTSPGVVPRHRAIGDASLLRVGADPLKQLHRSLAETLELFAPEDDAEAISHHWAAYGDRARAGRHALVAAERGLETFAFERARDVANNAATLVADDASRARALCLRGEAYAALGHGAEAARSFTEASKWMPRRQALDLERRAAELLLKSGRIREGTAALDRVLAHVGLRRPETRAASVASFTMQRVRKAVVTRLPKRPPSAKALDRADAAWSVASGLGFVDPIIAADFATRYWLICRESDDPMRRLRGLTAEALTLAGRGEPTRGQVVAMLAESELLAARDGSAAARASVLAAKGVAAAVTGRFHEAVKACELADAVFKNEVRTASWDRITAQHFLLWSLFECGRVDELMARAPEMLLDAQARGDHYAATGFAAHYANLAWLLRDRDEAKRVVDTCERAWQGEGFCLLRYDIAMARAHAAILDGTPQTATDTVEDAHRQMKAAFYLHVEALRLDAAMLRARLAIACVRRSRGLERAAHIAHAVRSTHAVSEARLPTATVEGKLTAACLRAAIGDSRGAERALTRVVPELERQGLTLYAGLARHVLGEDVAPIHHGDALASIFLPGFT